MQHKYSQTFQFVDGKVMQRSQPKITISYNNFLNDSSYRKAGGITTNNNIKIEILLYYFTCCYRLTF